MGKQWENMRPEHQKSASTTDETYKNSQIKRKSGIQYVNNDEGDHQHQDGGVRGSGLRVPSVVPGEGVDILHPLAVSVQKSTMEPLDQTMRVRNTASEMKLHKHNTCDNA